jgi:hypothetical protein
LDAARGRVAARRRRPEFLRVDDRAAGGGEARVDGVEAHADSLEQRACYSAHHEERLVLAADPYR